MKCVTIIIGTEVALKHAACVDHRGGGISCGFYFLVATVSRRSGRSVSHCFPIVNQPA